MTEAAIKYGPPDPLDQADDAWDAQPYSYSDPERAWKDGYRAGFLAAAGHAVCPGCGNEIDPVMCYCGCTKDDHRFVEDHPFVALGCDCYRAATLTPRARHELEP